MSTSYDTVSSPSPATYAAEIEQAEFVRRCDRLVADPAVQAELAEAFPTYEPTEEELDAKYQREVNRSEATADKAGIVYGFSHRTDNGGEFRGFADLPNGGERVYVDGWDRSMFAADEAAILLAGRLAAEITASKGAA